MNLDLNQAAEAIHVHPDTLRKMAKDGEAPGTKIGRRWIFPSDLLDQWVKQKCLSTDVNPEESGGSALAARLARARAQRTAVKRKSLKKSYDVESGDRERSETVVPFRGKRLPSDG